MSKKRSGGRSQPELFARSTRPTIPIEPNHSLVLLTDQTNWTELEARAEEIRLSKVKNAAGRPPHMRANLGAMMLKATRDMTWREVEDQVRHYAPARYLCGLTETEWTPDFTTVHDFAVLMGEDGVRLINEYTVKWAVAEKLADPSVVVGDTTAQEAAIPYPNEMGLLAAFVTSALGASKHAGTAFKTFASKVTAQVKVARQKVREYRLFAKDKSKAVKDKMMASMVNVIEGINRELGRAVQAAGETASRVKKHGIVAREKLVQLQQTMTKLIPQIRHWLKTGFVAKGKIINLHVSELYSIVRGKVGRAVEFGLSWGFTRLRGGFLLARLASERTELVDSEFAVEAVKDHISLFGKAPRAYAYDRGGYSAENVKAIKKLGVKEVGLAPRGRAKWAVSEKTRRDLVQERALVEAGIGAVKSSRYNFHRPRAKSTRMMGACGQLGVLGFNLNKLVRGLAARKKIALVECSR
jgi:hypothetical protein